MSVVNEITYSPVWLTRGLFHKSGGTVGSSYVTDDVIIYKLWMSGDSNNGRTIQYVNGVWSDLSSTENPVSVATNSNNAAVITFTCNDGTNVTTHTFNNPFTTASGGGTVIEGVSASSGGGSTPATISRKVFCNFW